MNTENNGIVFEQYVYVPFFGAAHVAREDTRRDWLPFFNREVRRTDSVYNGHGEKDGGVGEIVGFTLRAGRWQIITDRPRIGDYQTNDEPLAWNGTAWTLVAAPLVTLTGIVACLAGGLFKHFVAKPMGWLPAPRNLFPET